ncbi:hypothetical protein GCE86_21325 [Micromonospora terminaliae]|uniref:Uncharacterized protein n=1 Tax=Micromonospora terminaliae TaxID=1914461 RepID=A0AAJ2ZJN7_9ACTN|nr:hypothetical protein [Micromonospora terminaliae]NES31183.1 hypothetical protein [Micromonospora terminaliae]QGL49335.1 hypothetical protein GCE86_21325 [Micromonospora terminaliae]
MVKLAEETLTAVGRMTVAATELEHLLSRLGAADADADEIFARAGAPLLAAREAARSAPPAIREEYANLVEGAATQLAVGQAALRAVWRGGRTDAALFDEITARLLRCRDALDDRIPVPHEG